MGFAPHMKYRVHDITGSPKSCGTVQQNCSSVFIEDNSPIDVSKKSNEKLSWTMSLIKTAVNF